MLRRNSRFAVTASKHETIVASELAKLKAARRAVSKKNSALDERYAHKYSNNGKPMFNLKASNGQVIGTIELYSSQSARDGGAASVKTDGPMAAAAAKTKPTNDG